jgi:hypothetical protein
MDQDIGDIRRNETWDPVDLPTEKEVIGVKWVYKLKHAANGSMQKHKAMLVVKHFSQELGIYCNEKMINLLTSSPKNYKERSSMLSTKYLPQIFKEKYRKGLLYYYTNP